MISKFASITLYIFLLIPAGYSQTPQPPPSKPLYQNDLANLPEVLAKLNSGNFSIYELELISRGNAVEAIPALEREFTKQKEFIDQARIAQVLVKLGDKNDFYWNFLIQLVTPILESNPPDFLIFDAQGKSGPGPSPEFLRWIEAHPEADTKSSEFTIMEKLVYIFPAEITLLGWTHDPRAIPILQRALQLNNTLIQFAAAKGLAELHDSPSVPLIILACHHAPAEAAANIATTLIDFDTPEAQRAFDTYVPADHAKILREAKSKAITQPH
jgi:HEAT repeat protein